MRREGWAISSASVSLSAIFGSRPRADHRESWQPWFRGPRRQPRRNRRFPEADGALVLASTVMTSALSIARESTPVLQELRSAVEQALEGKPEAVELALIALLGRGHVLIEDVPGVGKTTLARALAKAVGGDLRRVQFTSDLLPSDVLGVSVYDQRSGQFVFRQGPIFANVLLADEINRASPRTQSAMLEAMNEGQVSVDGTTTPLPDPFFVLATQNPQDFAGTFPLPESQLDRFMVRIRLGYPPPHVEMRLLLQNGDGDRIRGVPQVLEPSQLVGLQREVDRVELDTSLATYLQAVLAATRSSPTLSLGASPRAGMNLARAARSRAVLHGRTYCIADDIHDLAVPVLAHRVRLAAHAEGYMPSRDECENAVRDIVARVPVPL
jgi:MoxR-like ATPase